MSDQSNPLFTPFTPSEPSMPFTPAPDVPPARTGKKKAAKATTPKRKPKPPKQPRAPDETPAAAKFDLQTILRAASTLKEEDYSTFDTLVGMNQTQRDRILSAIGKVFA